MNNQFPGLIFETPAVHTRLRLEDIGVVPDEESTICGPLQPIKKFGLESIIGRCRTPYVEPEDDIFLIREIERMLANGKILGAYDLYLTDATYHTPLTFAEFFAKYFDT